MELNFNFKNFPARLTLALETVTPAALAQINTKLDHILLTMATLEESLNAAYADIKASLTEAATELSTKLAELETALAAALATSPDAQAKLDELKTAAKALADIVPNQAPPA